MSMLDSFFNKGFKAAKCKTLLKLTIPRIKLLRNRREIQIKQMRRDIAKLLETGQEATARIRVEHIIREENMMAAQEIVELFCELISVRLPIIEAQRECPLDLKEAISSICFAAPRCADLPELLQVQMLFASKYGKEFVSAATELMPECGVNRQLIELLSIRAPSPDVKLKLLKEIAGEHELDWDPAASESELLKTHEDLLNGPTDFVCGSKLPLPEEKHDEASANTNDGGHCEPPDSDMDFDSLDLPEVPKVSLRPTSDASQGSETAPPIPGSLQPVNGHESLNQPATSEILSHKPTVENENFVEEKPVVVKDDVQGTCSSTVDVKEEKQFVPFISSPSFPEDTTRTPPSFSRTKSEVNVDLQDVLAAAQAAAETAEKAAAAARSAAALAQARIGELTKTSNDKFPSSHSENPFHIDIPDQSARNEKLHLYHQQSFDDSDVAVGHPATRRAAEDHQASQLQDLPSFDNLKVECDSPHNEHITEHVSSHHQPQRLASMEDDSYFSYPNLFSSQNSNLGSNAQSLPGDSHSSH